MSRRRRRVPDRAGGFNATNFGVGIAEHLAQNFRSVLLEVKQHIRAWVPVISLTKGLELDTSMRMTEIITEVLPGHPVGVLTGPNLAREIMAAVVEASSVTVTVKIRLGWDVNSIVAVDLATAAEACGVAAVTVHARTRSQGFSGTADWSMIRRVKESVAIPVIGNGDVRSAADAIQQIRA